MSFEEKHISSLLDLLKVSLFDQVMRFDTISNLTEDDWNIVKSIAEKQGVSAIVFDALDKLQSKGIKVSISMDLLMDWLGQTSFVESVYRQQYEESAELAKLWKSNDIRTLVFKGLALSRYYPVPAHREFGDFDCYLFGKYNEGNKIAEEHGCKVDTGWYKHSQIYYKGLMAENHNYFTQCRKGKKERSINTDLVDNLGDGSFLQSLDDTCLLLPPLGFEGLFIVYHSMAHFLLEGLSLRHICDWACWMNANQNKVSWSAFYGQCKIYGFDVFVDALNAISVGALGLSINNKDINIDNTYSQKILNNTLFEDSKIYSRGGKWFARYAVIRNAFRYSWKYREIAKYSMLEFIWSYVHGFIYREEDE